MSGVPKWRVERERDLLCEIEQLRVLNAQMLKALKAVWKVIDNLEPMDAKQIAKIRAAIAAAKQRRETA